jgi:2-polyprenyl-3-methyl-5-hydroxy-6-metoxy-1,4-benzoquinol methylase
VGQAALSVSTVRRGACPLCEASTFTAWRTELLECETCGLVVGDAVWRPSANEELNAQFFDHDVQPAPTAWVRLFEQWNNRRTMSRLRSAGVPASGLLLEVGVGSGSLLVYARQQGMTPAGCDISAAICRRTAAETGIRMFCGALDALPREALFDAIVMNHVVEHVAEPLPLLRAAHRHLRPGGLLHLAVPNVGSWEAHYSSWNSYEPYHLLYFTQQTLRRTVEQAGFDVRVLGTHEAFSSWFLVLTRYVRGMDVSRRPPSTQGRSRVIELGYRTSMIAAGALTWPLRRLQSALGKGAEVFLVARRT